MATTVRFKPEISVATLFGQPNSILTITVSVTVDIPAFSGDLDSLSAQLFFATVQSSSSGSAIVQNTQLPRISAPVPTWLHFESIQIASDKLPLMLIAHFWRQEDRGLGEKIKIGVKEVPFCGPPRVSRYIFPRCSRTDQS